MDAQTCPACCGTGSSATPEALEGLSEEAKQLWECWVCKGTGRVKVEQSSFERRLKPIGKAGPQC